MRLLNILLLCLFVQLLSLPLWAQDKRPSLDEVRELVMNHLKEKKIDDSPSFNGLYIIISYDRVKEFGGVSYNQPCYYELYLNESGEKFKVSLSTVAYYTESYNSMAIKFANYEISKDYTGVKVSEKYLKDDTILGNLLVDWDASSVEQIVSSIDYWVPQLAEIKEAWNTKVKGYQSLQSPNDLPFYVLGCDERNTDINRRVISNFGDPIHDVVSKYIQFRLHISSTEKKKVAIYAMVYRTNGKLVKGYKSPAGYSYSHEIKIKKGTGSYELCGWGGNDYGHWSEGDYLAKFYCEGQLIYSHYFTIH